MPTPYDKLLMKTPPEVLKEFEKAYKAVQFLNGVCSSCGAYVGDELKHLDWHKSTAKQRWVITWNADIIRFVDGST